jgi:hypothetical protein
MPDRAPTTRPIKNQPLTEAVQRQMARILKSPHFRTSKRAQDCLRFIVERALEGDNDQLKERCIGTDVFGRDPDYDTGADSIVRVAVNELRKKLAQYYLHSGPEEEIVIDVPPGSYVPEFSKAQRYLQPAPVDHQPPVLWRHWRITLAGVVLLAGLSLALVVLLHRPPADSTLTEFWSPLLRSPRPVLISIGNPLVYARQGHRDLPYYRLSDAAPPVEGSSPDVFFPIPDQFFGAGDAMAGMSLAAAFTKMGKAFEVRPASEVPYADLSGYPVVFIGFSDKMHLQMVKDLRFTFDVEKDAQIEDNVQCDLPMIRDHLKPENSWRLPGIKNNGKTERDYVLISRLLNSETGQPIVQVAGITNYGSRAGGEFLSNGAYLRQAIALMPPNWSKKNLQIVCEIRVIGNGPTVPRVVGVHTW